MLALFEGDDRRGVRRPADADRFPQALCKFRSERAFRLVVRGNKGRERIRANTGERRIPARFQAVINAFADHCPIAEILGDTPDQFDRLVRERRDLGSRPRKEFLGRCAVRIGNDEQKLSPATGPQKQPGKFEFFQKRARHNLTNQSDPE